MIEYFNPTSHGTLLAKEIFRFYISFLRGEYQFVVTCFGSEVTVITQFDLNINK